MATVVNTDSLPREMQQHTYSIMYEVEGKHWWFYGRRRIIEGFVGNLCREIAKRKPRILDVGCGTGANLQMLSQFGAAEGVDVSSEALEFCRARGLARVKQGAAETLPYEDASFDLVTGLDVVEHLDDDLSGLREMRRVLRPGGRALLFVPAFMFLWGVQDDISNHRRRYTLRETKQKVERAGLDIELASYANFSFFFPVLAVRTLMRILKLRADSEYGINIPAMNKIFAKLFSGERVFVKNNLFPFGVSLLCVARKPKTSN